MTTDFSELLGIDAPAFPGCTTVVPTIDDVYAAVYLPYNEQRAAAMAVTARNRLVAKPARLIAALWCGDTVLAASLATSANKLTGSYVFGLFPNSDTFFTTACKALNVKQRTHVLAAVSGRHKLFTAAEFREAAATAKRIKLPLRSVWHATSTPDRTDRDCESLADALAVVASAKYRRPLHLKVTSPHNPVLDALIKHGDDLISILPDFDSDSDAEHAVVRLTQGGARTLGSQVRILKTLQTFSDEAAEHVRRIADMLDADSSLILPYFFETHNWLFDAESTVKLFGVADTNLTTVQKIVSERAMRHMDSWGELIYRRADTRIRDQLTQQLTATKRSQGVGIELCAGDLLVDIATRTTDRSLCKTILDASDAVPQATVKTRKALRIAISQPDQSRYLQGAFEHSVNNRAKWVKHLPAKYAIECLEVLAKAFQTQKLDVSETLSDVLTVPAATVPATERSAFVAAARTETKLSLAELAATFAI